MLNAGRQGQQIVAVIAADLRHEDPTLAGLAARQAGRFARLTPELLDSLQQASQRCEPYVRFCSAKALLHDEATRDEAVNLLINLLSCEDGYVAAKSAAALGEMKNEADRLGEPLESALDNSNQFVQLHAAAALQNLRGPNDVSRRTFQQVDANGTTPELRQWASQWLDAREHAGNPSQEERTTP